MILLKLNDRGRREGGRGRGRGTFPGRPREAENGGKGVVAKDF